MTCHRSGCDAPAVTVPIPPAYREFAPENAAAVAVCSRCLAVGRVSPGSAIDVDERPSFDTVSDAVPSGDAAVPFVLLLSNFRSLATNRVAIEALLDEIELAGVDPLLALDRLVADPSVDPAIDLARRRTQVESLLY